MQTIGALGVQRAETPPGTCLLSGYLEKPPLNLRPEESHGKWVGEAKEGHFQAQRWKVRNGFAADVDQVEDEEKTMPAALGPALAESRPLPSWG